MFVKNQRTIANSVSCNGRVSNKNCIISTVNFLPAKANTGIVFKRVDLKKNNIIKAIYSNIEKDNHRGITLVNKFGVKIYNVEHIMSAIWGSNIDNLIVEVNCAEIPITDGSTEPLLFLLRSAEFKELNAKRRVLEIEKEIEVKSKDSLISIKPSKSFIINMNMNLKSDIKLKESFSFDFLILPYKDTISRARSFYLKEDTKNIDTKEYRHDLEFARHEILDCIGALYLSGYFMFAEINCTNGNYDLYGDLLNRIFENKENYRII